MVTRYIRDEFFFFSSRRRHTRWPRDWSSDVCSSDLLRALLVPGTGIVDYGQVAEKMAALLQERGAEILTGARVTAIRRHPDGLTLETPKAAVAARYTINCAGLHSDRVAALMGVRPEVRIIPFRGEYYMLRRERRSLVRNLIYPVPDPEFPFLGVHFTRTVHGAVEAGRSEEH